MKNKTNNCIAICVSAITLAFLINCVPPAHMQARKYHYKDPKREDLVRTAERYIGVNYRFGGSNIFGFDCSGFVCQVYKKNRLNLPRTARSQYNGGKKLNIKIAGPGDLVFFRIDNKKIDHVGIITGDGRFVHSPSKGKKVSYARLDNPYWKKRYAGAVTYLK